MTKEELARYINENICPISEKELSLLESLLDITLKTNKQFNLTAIKDKGAFRELMIYDSLLPIKYVSLTKKDKVLDIGTGAGFPGLPLAICSEAKYALIDSTQKKISHICRVIDNFRLDNVDAIYVRAEEYAASNREKFDYVIARAVAPLNILLELCAPFAKVDGTIIAMKGSNFNQELEQAKTSMAKLDLELDSNNIANLPISNETRSIIIFKKKSVTNKKYPRQFGEIKSNPL